MRRNSSKEKSTHGGKRPGAGRPPSKFRKEAPHRARALFNTTAPVHVVMRGRKHISELRSDRVYDVLRAVLTRYLSWTDFHVIHFSIQDNHLHMLVEAANDSALERGMRSFTINAAKAINAAFGGNGRVFFRYHSTVIKTRRYARNTIAYVLGNWRRHKQDIVNGKLVSAMLDRFSSAVSFDGWSKKFKVPADHVRLPVSAPATDLLRRGWAFDGPLDPYAAPGPLW